MMVINKQESTELALSSIKETFPDYEETLKRIGYDLFVVWNSNENIIRADKIPHAGGDRKRVHATVYNEAPTPPNPYLAARDAATKVAACSQQLITALDIIIKEQKMPTMSLSLIHI